MDVLTKAIDKTEEFLGHTPHPAIVTVPLGAWVVSTVSDVLAVATGDREYDDAARISMGVGLVGASVAVVTGLRDYSYIPKNSPSHEVATRHGIGNALVGTLFTASYLLRQRDRQAGRPTGMLARLLGLAGASLGLYTAWLGGVLVEEMGEGVKPAMDQRQRQDGLPHSSTRERPDGLQHATGRQATMSGLPI
jgi:uncharacterized membrane protein